MPAAARLGTKIDMQETIDETLDFFLRTVDLTDKPS